jgi:sialic acid synthase SpsE
MMKTPSSEIRIGSKRIGATHPTYFIADIAANHDGDLGRAKELIYLAKDAGADAAKFQHFRADTIVSDVGFKSLGGQLSHQSAWRKSVFEVYADASLNPDWTPILKETCDRAGIMFLTSPYSFELIDAVDPYVPAYKIGSGDITWTEIMEYIASKGKPVLLACGAATQADVDRAVQRLLTITDELLLMQCNTNYTASRENFKYSNINVLATFKARYPGLLLGLSDHTPGHATVLGAVALGARAVEKHFTDDNDRDGPDHRFAMNPHSWREMVERTRELEYALGDGTKRIEQNESDTVVLQRRAIRAGRDLAAGERLERTMLECLRPCPQDAFAPFELGEVVGRRLRRPLRKGEHLKRGDIS